MTYLQGWSTAGQAGRHQAEPVLVEVELLEAAAVTGPSPGIRVIHSQGRAPFVDSHNTVGGHI